MSNVGPRAWIGPTTNWSQPDTVAKPKAATPRRLVLQKTVDILQKRHAHPQPSRQPLMLVNNQKSGHLGQGCSKDWTYRSSVLHHKPYFATTTRKFRFAKFAITISCVCSHSSARGISPQHNKTAQPNPGTNNSDTWRISETKVSEHNSISTKPRRSYGQVTKISSDSCFLHDFLHITTEYSADIRNRAVQG